MNDYNQIVPISELPRRYLELLRQASTTKKPVVLFRRNKPVGGLVDFDLLQTIWETQRKMELEEALKTIKEGEEAYKNKRTRVLKEPKDLWKKWPSKK